MRSNCLCLPADSSFRSCCKCTCVRGGCENFGSTLELIHVRRGFMSGLVGVMGIQNLAGGLLGVHGDGMIDSSWESHARARRIMTPQREYPIFTPVSSLSHITQLFQESGSEIACSNFV